MEGVGDSICIYTISLSTIGIGGNSTGLVQNKMQFVSMYMYIVCTVSIISVVSGVSMLGMVNMQSMVSIVSFANGRGRDNALVPILRDITLE